MRQSNDDSAGGGARDELLFKVFRGSQAAPIEQVAEKKPMKQQQQQQQHKADEPTDLTTADPTRDTCECEETTMRL